jgi:SPP1 gp7 family putative phage head morphogenesis protein
VDRVTTTPATSALDATAAQFRAALLRRDEAALKRLMAAYGPVYARIQADVAKLTAQIAAARAAGAICALQRQVVAEWARYAETASQVITDTQRQAVAEATTEAHALTVAALDDAGVAVGADVARLHPAAVADLVGVLGDGSPLRALLDQLGQQAARDVGQALTHAVAVGRSPRQTARDIRAALGGDLNRALTIARTEHLRAYRGASLRSYQENSDLLRGWQWRASPSRRTCPVCLAMDGQEFSLEEPFGSHVNCRCTPIPLLRDRETPPRETGEAWFARQHADVQRAMLGPGKHALYQEGTISLRDLVGVKDDPQWGRGRYQRSLRELRGGARAASVPIPHSPGTAALPYPIPHSLGAAVSLNAQLQAVRLNQIAALPPEWLGQQIDRMAVPQALPELDYHHKRHGKEFGGVSPGEYVRLFTEHIQRPDLMYFTGLRQSDQAVMWYLMAPDTGAVAQYNETRGVYWSFFQPKEPIVYLDSGLLWWAEVKQVGGQWIAQPWK